MQTPLRLVRKSHNLTLSKVAEGLKIDPATLSRIERAEHQVSAALAEKISKFYQGKISEIEILYPARFIDKSHQ